MPLSSFVLSFVFCKMSYLDYQSFVFWTFLMDLMLRGHFCSQIASNPDSVLHAPIFIHSFLGATMMMNPTASLLCLLLIIATCLSIVNGGALSKDAIEEKLETKNGNLRTNHTIAEHQTNIRRGGDKIGLVGFNTTTASSSRRRLKSTRLSVVVEFKSKEGKKRATNLARRILYESELFDVIAMEIH